MQKNEVAAGSKAVAGAKSVSSFAARMSCFVRSEEQLWLHKWSVYSTTLSKNPAKSAAAKPVSLFVTINCNHSASTHFRHWNFTIFVDLSQLCPTRGPVEGFVRPSSGVRCSKSVLHTDNLSLFWVSWIWHFCCRWSLVPLYHVCYHCSSDSNAFSTLP